MDSFEDIYKPTFGILFGIVIVLALLRVLIGAWFTIVPHSVEDAIISFATPEVMDVGFWAFLWYLLLEIWWVVKMLIVVCVFSAIITGIISLFSTGNIFGIIASLVLAAGCVFGCIYVYKSSFWYTPKMQIHGVRDHTYSFQQTGDYPIPVSEEDHARGGAAYGIVNKPCSAYTRSWKASEGSIKDDNDPFYRTEVAHLEKGDTILLWSPKKSTSNIKNNRVSVIIPPGTKLSDQGLNEILIDDENYDFITQRIKYKDFLQRMFSKKKKE